MKFPRFVVPASAIGTIFGVSVLIRDNFQGPTCSNTVSLAGKTAIVTGANSGIGKATATELAKRGGRVILACRDTKAGLEAREEIIEQTCNKNVQVRQLDLESLESIRNFAQQVTAEEKVVNILVNNAGVMHLKSRRQITSDGFESHLGVNFLGPYLLTRLLLPKIEKCFDGRVVNLVSIVMDKCKLDFTNFNVVKNYDTYQAYGQSKLALMAFTRDLSTRHPGITSCAVYPGVAKTRLARGLTSSKVSSTVSSPLSIFMRTPENACQTVVHCCTDPKIESGKLYSNLQVQKWKSELDETDAQRLWLIAEKWTKYNETDDQNVQQASEPS